MKLIETKNNLRHGFRDEDDIRWGEYKSWYDDGQTLRHCFYNDDLAYGEFKAWDKGGKLLIWSLDMGFKELLRFDHRTGFDNAEEVITKKARELNLPLFKDIPTDEEGRTFFALKHPNIPLLPISEQS